jgi:hypothetical protein
MVAFLLQCAYSVTTGILSIRLPAWLAKLLLWGSVNSSLVGDVQVDVPGVSMIQLLSLGTTLLFALILDILLTMLAMIKASRAAHKAEETAKEVKEGLKDKLIDALENKLDAILARTFLADNRPPEEGGKKK